MCTCITEGLPVNSHLAVASKMHMHFAFVKFLSIGHPYSRFANNVFYDENCENERKTLRTTPVQKYCGFQKLQIHNNYEVRIFQFSDETM